jgi:hypothetical protein
MGKTEGDKRNWTGDRAVAPLSHSLTALVVVGVTLMYSGLPLAGRDLGDDRRPAVHQVASAGEGRSASIPVRQSRRFVPDTLILVLVGTMLLALATAIRRTGTASPPLRKEASHVPVIPVSVPSRNSGPPRPD